MTINFGILGAGRISNIHCHNIYNNHRSKIVKIYDPNTFGEKLVFFHKGWTNEKLNEVIESEKLKTVNA